MIETIYICRHGYRQDWVNSSDDSGPTGVLHDPTLSDLGERQARELGRIIASPPDGPAPEMIFSSAFYRCIQTALPLSQALQKPLHLEMGLNEWFAPLVEDTGLHPRPSPAIEIAKHFPPDSMETTYMPTYYPSRRGESLDEVYERSEKFLELFLRRMEVEYPDVKAIVLFTHGAMLINIGRVLVGDAGYEIRAGTASTSKYVRQSGQAGQADWSIEWNGRTSYLPDGEVRPYTHAYAPDGPGDGKKHEQEDELPTGPAQGMERFL